MYSGRITVPRDAAAVLAVLADTSRIAAWNPAFSSLDGSGPALAGRPYRATIRGVARAVLRYTEIGETAVRYTMSGLGSREDGEWVLEASDEGTVVTHTFRHTGLILFLMRPAFAAVADWRLERLRDEVAAAS
ncbi:SRPBCC family protein [Sinomonas sp. G460-2]|uniref:SRPBCC family protein n=1 Tax=Sinomonas sp. G460-2 TaxID=3393464 RepID=UPI0039EE2A33